MEELELQKDGSVVSVAAAGAAATGAVPIPFSDASVLIPVQISMLAKITTIFGLPIEKGMIAAIVSSTIGTAGATILGKTVVSNLLRFIPGVGSVAGGFISGSTALALTVALGEAYISIMLMVCKGELGLEDLGTDAGKQKIHQIFIEKLKLDRKY